MQPLNYWIERLLFPRAVKNASSIITVSNHTQSLLQDYYPNSASKLNRIYEAAFSSPGQNTSRLINDRYILAVGTREPRKNYERLLRAFSSVVTRERPLKLVIAGGSGWGRSLEGVVDGLQLEERVLLLEGVSDKELSNLYAFCEFLAMPSIYEGFGLPIVEAMAHGKAILTTKNSAMSEVAGQAAITVDPLDTEDIIEGLNQLLSNRSYKLDLEQQAKRRSLEFSWVKSGQLTIQVINETVERANI